MEITSWGVAAGVAVQFRLCVQALQFQTIRVKPGPQRSILPGMKFGKSALGATAAVLLSVGPSLATANAEPDVKFIRSPDGNISCEMDFQRPGLPDGVFCTSMKPPQNVFMDINGVLRICSNEERCVSDGPEDAVVLAYGQNSPLGPFNCLSEGTGMHCTVPSEHGFVINGAGIDPVDPK